MVRPACEKRANLAIIKRFAVCRVNPVSGVSGVNRVSGVSGVIGVSGVGCEPGGAVAGEWVCQHRGVGAVMCRREEPDNAERN